jgi:hypothetical protein
MPIVIDNDKHRTFYVTQPTLLQHTLLIFVLIALEEEDLTCILQELMETADYFDDQQV